MKISVARKEHPCSFIHCSIPGKRIKKGDVYVGFSFNRRIEDRHIFVMLRFHPECWEQNRLIDISKVKEQVKELEDKVALRRERVRSNRPRGRPRKYADPLKARNIISQMNYHKKVGNWSLVEALERQLKELEVASI